MNELIWRGSFIIAYMAVVHRCRMLNHPINNWVFDRDAESNLGFQRALVGSQ